MPQIMITKSGAAGADANSALASTLQNKLRTEGQSFVSSSLSGQIASLESLSAPQQHEVVASLEALAAELRDLAGTDLTPAQEAAAATVLAAAANPAAWQRKVLSARSVSTEGVTLVPVDGGGRGGDYGYVEDLHPALESFDNSNLSDFLGASIVYNLQNAKQGALAEAFFRTVAITPDNGGADLSIRTPYVFNHFLRGTDGAPVNFARKRLIEAAFNHTVLSDESTTIYPEVKADNSNAQYFVPAAAVTPVTLDLGNRSVRTAPLAVGRKVDLIGLSQAPNIARNGVADNTDSLDRTNGLKRLYMQVDGADVISFDVSSSPRSFFVRSAEHEGREQLLHFRTGSLQLNSKTRLHAGGAVVDAALALIVTNEYKVNLSVTLTGELNTETGNAVVNPGRVEVHSIYNAAGEKLALNALGDVATIVAAVATIEVIGWDPNSRLSNANRRERGLQLDLQTYTERYPVPLGAPMSIPSPLAENRDASEMNLLISAVRQRNDNNAITKLINYADTMQRWDDARTIGGDENGIAQIEGIARFLLQRPWFREMTVNVPDHINSVKTSEKIADLQALLVNLIRDGVYDALRETGIKKALEAVTGGADDKLKVVVGTDPVLSRYLMVTGDTRTMGPDLDVELVTDTDERLSGWIYYTFGREGEGMDPFNFGSFLWMPEMISNVTVARNNAQYREAMVQPRGRHVVHLPILGRIKITGLNEVITDATQFPVLQYTP